MRGTIRLPREALQPYLFEVPATRLDWVKVFGNAGPVEVEIGFGKGLFLLAASQARPHVNFFGIEVERKLQLFTANRLAKRNIRNVRLARGDARAIVRDLVPAASVQAIYVYFPDPWWKRRHKKRRLFTAEFAKACAAVLNKGGRIEVLSDVEEYFQVITALLNRQPLLQTVPPSCQTKEFRTNFERKATMLGKPVYSAAYEAMT